jgi:hypothetical protein
MTWIPCVKGLQVSNDVDSLHEDRKHLLGLSFIRVYRHYIEDICLMTVKIGNLYMQIHGYSLMMAYLYVKYGYFRLFFIMALTCILIEELLYFRVEVGNLLEKKISLMVTITNDE